MTQYARQIDGAIRPVLAGSDLPLILAAADPLDGIFRAVNSYPGLAAAGISGNPETTPVGDLASAARTILDELYAADLAAIRERFEALRSQGRASTDIVDVARAATYGAVDTLLVDIDEVVPGRVDETTGAVTFEDADDAVNYGVVDEIARRAFLSGARVLGVRSDDIPGNGSVAAIPPWRTPPAVESLGRASGGLAAAVVAATATPCDCCARRPESWCLTINHREHDD